MKKLSIGIIGTGAIATQFVQEALQFDGIKLAAVVARDYQKTQQFATKWQIPQAFATVEELLADVSIDAVYIATLHPTHAQYSKQALLANKHVLCEKPAAIKPWQIAELHTIAKQQHKLFMEAITIGFHPLYQEIKNKIQQGEIGTLTHIEVTLGKMSKKEHKHTPELAGGCIYDIGIYNLFLILDFLGMPINMQAQMRKHRQWDVPGTVQMLMQHQRGEQSYNMMTMDACSTTMATFIGTEGTIIIPKSWTLAQQYNIVKPDGEVIEHHHKINSWLGYELLAFHQLILEGKIESDIISHKTSYQLQQIIEQLYECLDLSLPEEAIII